MSVPVSRALLRKASPSEAAAMWKIQHDSGGPVEAGLFEEWLAADEAHAAAWAALDHTWSMFDDAEDPLFAQLRQDALGHAHPSGIGMWWGRWGGLAAAVLAVAVLGASVTVFRLGKHSSQVTVGDRVAMVVYRTTTERRTLVLADGSQVALAENSQIRAAIGPKDRQVTLDHGRALFTVRHDQARPFMVTAGQWSVTDVGTRFEVGLDKAAMHVALFEGSVRIDGEGGAAPALVPGQQLMAMAGEPYAVSMIKAPAVEAAADGMTEFNNATLAQAVEQFNAVNVVKLRIMDSKVAGLRITGRFRLDDPVRFSQTISQLLPITVAQAGADRIELAYRR